MRRLFSTFAPGAPGVGLLLMRAAAGAALIAHAVHVIDRATSAGLLAALVASGLVGILVLVGLWTPIAGVLTAVAAGWIAYAGSTDAAFWAVVGADGIALALLGPGVWSIDAHLFGWKRLEPRNGNGGAPPLD